MTTSAVPLRTRSACHQGPKSANSPCCSEVCGASNLYNLDSFGILLTNPPFFHGVNKCTASALGRAQTVTLFDPAKRIGRQAHPSFEGTPKRSCVPGTEAGSLDWALAEVGPEREERRAGVLRLCRFRLPCVSSTDINTYRHPLWHRSRRSIMRLRPQPFDRPGDRSYRVTTNDISESQVVRRPADHSLLDRTAGLHQHSGDPGDADGSQDAARGFTRDHSRKNREQAQ